MKILKIKYLALLSLLTIFTSCSLEEENIFGDTAAVRMDKALSSFRETLYSSENGWIMEYFPTDTTEGYTIWMKFNASTKVDLMAQNRWTNNQLLSDSCVFDLLGDNGPVLSFPVAGNFITPGGTRVGIFHIFALPQDPLGNSSALNGYGLAGDYEFIMMNVKEDLIQLKGKKRSTRIQLKRLSPDITPEAYFAGIQKVREFLFQNSNQMDLSLVDGTDTLSLLNSLSSYGAHASKYKIYKPGTDPLITGEDHAYILTPNGIRFHTPYVWNGKNISKFEFSSDNQKLICTDSLSTASIEGPDPVQFFDASGKIWKINSSMELGADLKAIYDQIVQNCQTVYKEKFQSLSLTYSTVRKSYTLMFVSGKYTGYFDFTKTVSGNQIVFQYAGTKDKNANIYLTNIDGFSQLLNVMSQPFTVTPECGLNLTLLKLSGVNNSAVNFYIN